MVTWEKSFPYPFKELHSRPKLQLSSGSTGFAVQACIYQIKIPVIIFRLWLSFLGSLGWWEEGGGMSVVGLKFLYSESCEYRLLRTVGVACFRPIRYTKNLLQECQCSTRPQKGWLSDFKHSVYLKLSLFISQSQKIHTFQQPLYWHDFCCWSVSLLSSSSLCSIYFVICIIHYAVSKRETERRNYSAWIITK